MTDISHIWFDFGGTLYRETELFNTLHDEFRFNTYAKLQSIDDLGVAKQEFLALYHVHGSNSAVFKALGQASDYWMKALDGLDLKSVLQPDPNVTNTLRKLSDTTPVSLFTNFNRAPIEGLLTHLKIPASLFSTVLSGDDIAERKPALDGFHKMVELSKLPPERILYVGDRVDVDIRPAKRLGMQTALLYGHSDEADYCFQEFSQLTQLL